MKKCLLIENISQTKLITIEKIKQKMNVECLLIYSLAYFKRCCTFNANNVFVASDLLPRKVSGLILQMAA